MRWPVTIGSIAGACAVTPLALAMSAFAAGGGHGTYVLAKLFFPYTMLSTRLFEVITPPFIALAIIQYPVYGVLLALAEWKGRFRLVAVFISSMHLLAVLLCLAIRMPFFP